MISKINFDHNDKYSKTHRLDTGMAVENLMLQGKINGLVIHGIEGFDYEKARINLNIPEEYDIECMIAIGKK